MYPLHGSLSQDGVCWEKSMKAQCNECGATCTVLEKNTPFYMACFTRLLSCFCLCLWESRTVTGTGTGKWDSDFLHLCSQCPAVSTSDFIEEILWEVPAPLWFNWNTEHSDSLCLRYIQPSQPLHFLHRSCFILSVKCSVGSVRQESPADTVVRLVCSIQILLVPIYNMSEKTIVPHQSGYCKTYLLLPKTTTMSGNKLAMFALMVQSF